MLGRSAAKGGEGKKKRWSHPKEWRRLTWIKLTIWTIPTIVLLVVLLHVSPSSLMRNKGRKLISSNRDSNDLLYDLLVRPSQNFDNKSIRSFIRLLPTLVPIPFSVDRRHLSTTQQPSLRSNRLKRITLLSLSRYHILQQLVTLSESESLGTTRQYA